MNARMAYSLILPVDWMGFVWYLSKENIKRQYARTRLGPIWIVLTQFVTIMGIGLVFFSIFDRPLKEFLPFISASIISWNFMSVSITLAPTVFTAQTSIIQSFKVPFSIFPLQNFINAFVIYLHGLVIHLVLMVFLGVSFRALPFLLISLVLVSAIIYPLIAVLGLLGARYRDLAPAIASAMYMAFLVTPVIWERFGIVGEMVWIVDFNPLYHMIELLRRPLLGAIPDPVSILACAVMAILSLTCGEWFFRRYSRPIPFWV